MKYFRLCLMITLYIHTYTYTNIIHLKLLTFAPHDFHPRIKHSLPSISSEIFSQFCVFTFTPAARSGLIILSFLISLMIIYQHVVERISIKFNLLPTWKHRKTCTQHIHIRHVYTDVCVLCGFDCMYQICIL